MRKPVLAKEPHQGDSQRSNVALLCSQPHAPNERLRAREVAAGGLARWQRALPAGVWGRGNEAEDTSGHKGNVLSEHEWPHVGKGLQVM